MARNFTRPPAASGARPGVGVAEAEVVAQGGALVLGAEHAALLQQRDDLVGELVEAAGGDVRDEDEAVAGVGLHEVVDGPRRRWPGVPTKVCRLPVLDDQVADGPASCAAASSRHSRAVASGSRYIADLGAALGDGAARRASGSMSGSGPSGS